jgi:hypothetical protein
MGTAMTSRPPRTEAQKATRKAYDKRRRAEGIGPNVVRDSQGVTATLREQDMRDVRTIVRAGYVRDALQEIVDWCDEHEGDWRVLCLSTPRTIREDLRGYRVRQRWDGVAHTVCPEANMLGHVARKDLLDPSLL